MVRCVGHTKASCKRTTTSSLAYGFRRILHLLELSGELLFLGVLSHFVLYPPTQPIITGNERHRSLREYFLTCWPITTLIRPWSLGSLPSLLVFLSFIFSLPSIPLPNDTSFMVLHLALALRILFLHFPLPPSPLFLLPFRISLPLSVLLTHSVSRVFFPIILFFLPVILVSVLLLSLSLGDTTFRFLTLDPTPMQTRTVFLILAFIVTLLLILTLVMGASKFPSLSVADNAVSSQSQKWDRFSEHIGLDARRAFVRSLLRYSKPTYFPPPLNFLQVVLIRLPAVIFITLGKKSYLPFLETLERLLWRATVGPIACIVAGFWLWGLWT